MNCPAVVLIWWTSRLSASNILEVVESTERVIDTTVNNGDALADISEKMDSILEYLAPLNDALVSINNLLYRLNEYVDYIVAFAVVILLCILYYRYLEYFTRF